MCVLPSWVPIWSLFSLAAACLEVPLFLISPSELEFNTASRLDLFLSAAFHEAGFALPVLVSAIPLVWFAYQKQQHHRTMLDQISHFDIHDAKCSLETDRLVIERMVERLFSGRETRVSLGSEELQEALIASQSLPSQSLRSGRDRKEEVLGEFNAYVKGPLKERVVRNLGLDTQIPLKLCFLGVMPLCFLTPLYSCEGHLCKDYARHLGISTTTAVSMNLIMNMIETPGTHCFTFPLQMRASALITSRVSHKGLQICLVLLLGIFIECLRWCFACTVKGFAVVIVAQFSPWYLAGLLGCLGIFGWHFWLLFLQPGAPLLESEASRGLARVDAV